MFKQSKEQFKEPPDKPLEYRTIALVINPAAVFIKQQIKFWHLIIADFRTKETLNYFVSAAGCHCFDLPCLKMMIDINIVDIPV